MADRSDHAAVTKVETRGKKPAPAANEGKTIQASEPAPRDEMKKDKREKEKRNSRLAMSHREAEIIAQHLKESGTRR